MMASDPVAAASTWFVRPCDTCRQELALRGIGSGTCLGWTTIDMIVIGQLVSPLRGRLNADSRRQAADLSERLEVIARGGSHQDTPDVGASGEFPPSLRAFRPCVDCCARIAEVNLTRGPYLFIGPRLASALGSFVRPARGRLSQQQRALAGRLMGGLVVVIDAALERVKFWEEAGRNGITPKLLERDRQRNTP